MKVLVTGCNGQLGTDLCVVLHDHELIPLRHADLDITDIQAVQNAFENYLPDVIINTAAYVRVDDCETNQNLAFRVNAEGARNVAIQAGQLGAKLFHLSTDYVFGGEGPRFSPFSEYDTPIPLNIYGKSKLAGEEYVRQLCSKHFIIRGSGLFGVAGSSGKGGNFIETILRLARERNELNIVDDQIFSPSYTKDLASKIVDLIDTDFYGTFHITNTGECSWYAFARESFRLAGINVPLIPISSTQYPQKARRPTYSVLGHYHLEQIGMNDLRGWKEALAEYMKEKGHLKT
jgi:dTDP-4-dehydrorhamnose reductase